MIWMLFFIQLQLLIYVQTGLPWEYSFADFILILNSNSFFTKPFNHTKTFLFVI